MKAQLTSKRTKRLFIAFAAFAFVALFTVFYGDLQKSLFGKTQKPRPTVTAQPS